MTNPIKAATIKQTFGNFMVQRWLVVLDHDAAEIMGETRLRYLFASKLTAEKFADVLQGNLDAAYADAMGE